jgi:hypothetical protein
MSTANAAVTTPASRAPIAVARPRSRFYLGLTALMVGIVLVGFWPSYFGPMLQGNIARPLVIQLHGLVFVGWMALLVAQVVLVARGQVHLHRQLGRLGVAYGCAVIVMGLVVGVAAPVMKVRAGEWDHDRGAAFLLVTLGDMVLFGSLFGAAVAQRHRPAVHKRLMVAATVALLFAAVGRMPYITSALVLTLIWFSPLLAGMAYDVMTSRRVHPTWIISAVFLFVGGLRLLVSTSETWLRIGRPLLDAFL